MYWSEEVKHIHEEKCDILQTSATPDIFTNQSVQYMHICCFIETFSLDLIPRKRRRLVYRIHDAWGVASVINIRMTCQDWDICDVSGVKKAIGHRWSSSHPAYVVCCSSFFPIYELRELRDWLKLLNSCKPETWQRQMDTVADKNCGMYHAAYMVVWWAMPLSARNGSRQKNHSNIQGTPPFWCTLGTVGTGRKSTPNH